MPMPRPSSRSMVYRPGERLLEGDVAVGFAVTRAAHGPANLGSDTRNRYL